MQIRQIIASATCAAGTILSVGHANAVAPIASVHVSQSAVMPVSQRCWWSHGLRHCRGVGPRYYGYRGNYREYNNPNAYRTGSSRWWQEMDRLDRGGRGRR
jgi:hypothetical protein